MNTQFKVTYIFSNYSGYQFLNLYKGIIPWRVNNNTFNSKIDKNLTKKIYKLIPHRIS